MAQSLAGLEQGTVSLWKLGQDPWGILGAVQAPTRSDSSPEEGLGLPRHTGGRQ